MIGEAIALRASYRQGSSRRLRQVLAGRRAPAHEEADLCEMTFRDQTDCSATRDALLSLLQILDSDVHKNPLLKCEQPVEKNMFLSRLCSCTDHFVIFHPLLTRD